MPARDNDLLDVEMFFQRDPAMLPLAHALFDILFARYPDASIKVDKTQIALCDPVPFVIASLPVRRMKDWPVHCIVCSLLLDARLDSARVAVAVEPYPGRWTHHLLLTDAAQLDDELLGWADRARTFRRSCARGKKST